MLNLRPPRRTAMTVGAVALCLGLVACRPPALEETVVPSIVGTWLVKIPEAPFPWHLFIFHSDGTVQQSNPDSGDPNRSDSNLMGVWEVEGDHIKGKVVELAADRRTHQFVSRDEISFTLKPKADTLSGNATARFYDADSHPLRDPLALTLAGQRILPR